MWSGTRWGGALPAKYRDWRRTLSSLHMQGPSACLRFVRAVRQSMCVHADRLEIGGHDAVNTHRLEIQKAVPGRIEGTFRVEKENRE